MTASPLFVNVIVVILCSCTESNQAVVNFVRGMIIVCCFQPFGIFTASVSFHLSCPFSGFMFLVGRPSLMVSDMQKSHNNR